MGPRLQQKVRCWVYVAVSLLVGLFSLIVHLVACLTLTRVLASDGGAMLPGVVEAASRWGAWVSLRSGTGWFGLVYWTASVDPRMQKVGGAGAGRARGPSL